MPKPTHTQIETLLRGLILPLHQIKRDIPLPIGERRWENDAEHSWSTAILACSLAPEIDPTLDVGKVCQFAVAHDLLEAYADDTSPFGSKEKLLSKAQREAAALESIAKEYAHFSWIIQTVKAYERKDTNEALFVSAIDKYVPAVYDVIDEGQLFRERGTTLAEYKQLLADQRDKVHRHPGVGKYYDEVRALLEEHPEYFHPETETGSESNTTTA